MCGIYGFLPVSVYELEERFNLTNVPQDIDELASLKIAPKSTVATVSRNSPNRLVKRVWWLAPPWVDDPYNVDFPTFNARSEGIREKASFKNAWNKAQRCLILASYFVEWQDIPDPDNPQNIFKQPWRVQVKNESTFAFAGLYEVWTDAEGEEVQTCTIITTDSSDSLQGIHPRMPVILEKRDEDTWLDRKTDKDAAYALLKSFPDEKLEKFPIDPYFNKARAEEVNGEMISRHTVSKQEELF